MKREKIVIIGGGLIGLFSAWYLRKEGFEVTLLDAGKIPGQQSCSYGNAGMIVPSHYVPLATRAALRQALTSQFKRHAAIRLKLASSRELLPWLLQFSSIALKNKAQEKMGFLARIGLESRELYQKLEHESGLPVHFHPTGIQMVCRRQQTLEHEARLGTQAAQWNIPAEIWSRDEFLKKNPGLEADIAGAVYYPLDGIIDPFPLQKTLVEELTRSGVSLMQHQQVTGWEVSQNRVAGVRTSEQTISGDYFLIAAGDQSPALLEHLGMRIPVLPGKGISYLGRRTIPAPAFPTLLQDEHIAITPYETHVRVASHFILGDRTPDIRIKDLLQIDASITNTITNWKKGQHHEAKTWAGYRPVSPDGLPLIGESRKYPNLSIASGHAMIGVSLAPFTGSMIAALASGKKVDQEALRLLAPGRFGQAF